MNPARFDAQKLYEWGFANRVVADDDVLETAVAIAREAGLRRTRDDVALTSTQLNELSDDEVVETILRHTMQNE